ncbi:cytochrome P450 [Sphingobium sp. EM0848]|uniref:cytochrome P450 n=1 Tax=Sphingobium sp. EM0848 TaxID=2743473 RepID=UPI00159CA374|nr:cytochrome P450 [Sphingobium sp. EM0848]
MKDATVAERPRLPGFSVADDGFLRDPFLLSKRAHEEAPIFFDDQTNSWMITKYQDVAAVLSDYQTFSSRAVGRIPVPAKLASRAADFVKDEIIFAIDPPEHTLARATIQNGFARKIIDSMAGYAAIAADEIIDSVIDSGEGNMIEICYAFSMRVITQMLNLPKEYSADYRRWAEALFALLVPKKLDSDEVITTHLSAQQIEARWTDLADAGAFLRETVLERQKNPGGDLISAMIMARDANGNAIDPGAVVRHSLSLITAGFDTTATLLAHLILHFTRNPDQLALLKADPSLANNAVEEGLRRQGSTLTLFRIATKDVTLHDHLIPRGSLVCALIPAANLDADMFSDPARFDIRRINANRHLGLGRGRHACAGQPLVRVEAPIGLRKLYERMPDLRIDLDKPIEYMPAFGALTVTSMPAVWSPR